MSASLLIPCYNAATCLPRLLESVRQLKKPFDEILCFDDGSQDDTIHVAEGLGVPVLRGGTNRGVSYARNRLAEAASGEWLHFHDADDLIHAEYLSKSLAAPNSEVVLCDSIWVDEMTRQTVVHWTFHRAAYDRAPCAYVLAHPVGVLSALISRVSFLGVGGFNENVSCWEDADLFVRLAASGARFHMLEETLVTSLRHQRGLSRDQGHCYRCRVRLLRDYVNLLDPSLHGVIASELEKVIPQLLRHGDRDVARSALELARTLGANPPTSSSLLLQISKLFLPSLWLMQSQDAYRRRLQRTR